MADPRDQIVLVATLGVEPARGLSVVLGVSVAAPIMHCAKVGGLPVATGGGDVAGGGIGDRKVRDCRVDR